MTAIIIYNRIGGVGVMLAEYYIHNILICCIIVTKMALCGVIYVY